MHDQIHNKKVLVVIFGTLSTTAADLCTTAASHVLYTPGAGCSKMD